MFGNEVEMRKEKKSGYFSFLLLVWKREGKSVTFTFYVPMRRKER